MIGLDGAFGAVNGLLTVAFGTRIVLAYPALPAEHRQRSSHILLLSLVPSLLLSFSSIVAAVAAAAAAFHFYRFPSESRIFLPAASLIAGIAGIFDANVSIYVCTLLLSIAVSSAVIAAFSELGVWARHRSYAPILPTDAADDSVWTVGDGSVLSERPVPPVPSNCSLLSLLYFSWFHPVVATGRERALELEDIPTLAKRLRSETQGDRFARQWRAELEANASADDSTSSRVAPVSPVAAVPGVKADIWRALVRTYGRQLLTGGSLKLLNDVCVFLSPMLLRSIILHLQYADEHPGHPGNISKGLMYACLLFVVYNIQSLAFNAYFGKMAVLQAQISSAMITAVYEKSCKLSSTELVSMSAGMVQNLMAVDAKTLADVVLYLNTLWSGTGQIIVSLVLLYQLLGVWPTIAGLLVMLLIVPLQAFIVRIMKKTREMASGKTDERVKVVGEALAGISVVKYMAWERAFIRRILESRIGELDMVRQSLLLQATNSTVMSSIPVWLALVSLGTYALVGGALDAAVIFPAIALFNVLRPSVILLPNVIISCTRAAAAAARIEKFLLADELPVINEAPFSPPAEDFKTQNSALIVRDMTVAWDPLVGPILSRANMQVPEGSLVLVLGSVASGKSTLLASILGECHVLSGQVGYRPGSSVAFCDQEAFIQNATLRENVLFGAEMNERRYRRTLRVTSLLEDLKVLPEGDLTEIGGRGVNLSGGQKARVSLARAVYRNADIVLLDAPLAAVDAIVGKSIWDLAITGELAGRTRIMTTNHVSFCTHPAVDYVAVLANGTVEFGTPSELAADDASEFSKLLAVGQVSRDKSSGDLIPSEHMRKSSDESVDASSPLGDEEDGIRARGLGEDLSNTSNGKQGVPSSAGVGERGRLISRETKSRGRVALRHFAKYFESIGGWRVCVGLLLAFALGQAASLGSSIYLSVWSEESRLRGYDQGSSGLAEKLWWFAVISMFAIILPGIGNFSIVWGSIRASVRLHEELSLAVFGSPMSYFDTTPTGRILNRFNSSIDKVDNQLAFTLQTVVRLFCTALGTFLLILYATPAFVFAILPVSYVYMIVQSYYRQSAVDLRRLESVSRSPLYAHFGETLDGVQTLRAYGSVPRMRQLNQALTNRYQSTAYASQSASRWLSCRLDFLASSLTFAAASLCVLAQSSISPELIALSLSYSMQMVGMLSWSVRQVTEAESQFSAVEQIAEFSPPHHPQEEKLPRVREGDSRVETRGLVTRGFLRHMEGGMSGRQANRWPRAGAVEFRDVKMRYRPELDLCLRGLSLQVPPGSSVGLVGRSGAGKSSLVSTLFRIVELESGKILIDGKDIAEMRLEDLRSSLGIIAQSPVLFSGSIRTNLDMANAYSDESVNAALNLCGLRDTSNRPLTLDTEVTENGSNLSLGQRQLLCLGRVLLRDSKVCVLDEATSAVDVDTDRRMGETIRREMKDRTLFVVAHRLHTIMNCDKVCVLDYGRVAEFGSPIELLDRPESMFSSLVNETGPETAALLRSIAEGSSRTCGPEKCVSNLPVDGSTVGNGHMKRSDSENTVHEAYAQLRAAILATSYEKPSSSSAASRNATALRRMISSLSALANVKLDPELPIEGFPVGEAEVVNAISNGDSDLVAESVASPRATPGEKVADS